MENAYRTIGKHIFEAHRIFTPEGQRIIILADNLEEAKKKAENFYGFSSFSSDYFISVTEVIPTEDAQIYKI